MRCLWSWSLLDNCYTCSVFLVPLIVFHKKIPLKAFGHKFTQRLQETSCGHIDIFMLKKFSESFQSNVLPISPSLYFCLAAAEAVTASRLSRQMAGIEHLLNTAAKIDTNIENHKYTDLHTHSFYCRDFSIIQKYILYCRTNIYIYI